MQDRAAPPPAAVPAVVTCSGVDGGDHAPVLGFLAEHAGTGVELGVQVSAARQGEPRYPTLEWTEGLLRAAAAEGLGGVALHVNGSLASLVADQGVVHGALRRLLEVRRSDGAPVAGRVQLNMNASARPDLLAGALAGVPGVRFVLQIHGGTEALLAHPCLAAADFDVIIDRSRGRGVRDPGLLDLPPGAAGRFVTYAGGMAPETVADDVAAIAAAAGGAPFGVDAETGLREDGRFSFARAAAFVAAARGAAARP